MCVFYVCVGGEVWCGVCVGGGGGGVLCVCVVVCERDRMDMVDSYCHKISQLWIISKFVPI